jgi:hypothetical protein
LPQLTATIKRALDYQEKEKMRVARANLYSTHKRKDFPSSTPESTSSTTISNTQPAAISSAEGTTYTDVLQAHIFHKRAKMTLPQKTLEKKRERREEKAEEKTKEKQGAFSTSQAIVRFYDSDLKEKDAFGRTQEEILSWNDTKLEASHNYIQMLFPLPEGSPYNSEVGKKEHVSEHSDSLYKIGGVSM